MELRDKRKLCFTAVLVIVFVTQLMNACGWISIEVAKGISLCCSWYFLLECVLRIKHVLGYCDKWQCIYCLICILFSIVCSVFGETWVRAIYVALIYGYYALTEKHLHQQVRKQTMILGIFMTISTALRMNSLIVVTVYLLYLFRLANPMLEKIAVEHKKNSDEEAVEGSWIKRILFGRNGRFEIPGIKRKQRSMA